MNLLLVSATPFEIAPLSDRLRAAGWAVGPDHFEYASLRVEVLISGVGLPLTAYALGQRLAERTYDLVIQAGVAGAIDRELALTEVVEVVSDCFGDLGVEEADGGFTAMSEMGLIAPDAFPFRAGRLWNAPDQARKFLPQVHGLSVNKVHGTEASVRALREKYPFAQVETMEGAAFFYATLQQGVPALQIRAVSNYVERRQRENWRLAEAIDRLNEVLTELLLTLV